MRAFRRFFWIATLLAAIVAWLELFWPVATYYSAHPESRSLVILGLLFDPYTKIYSLPFFSTLFLLLSLSLLLFILSFARLVINYITWSLIDICVLEFEAEITFTDPQMVGATSTRTQTFHANRGGISAY